MPEIREAVTFHDGARLKARAVVNDSQAQLGTVAQEIDRHAPGGGVLADVVQCLLEH